MDLPYLDPSSPEFPPQLSEIPHPPARLWLRGPAAALTGTSVAIVGSRSASALSLEVARRLAADLAAIGLTIVSGLARGCDAAAHQGALDAGGRTIAVLGSGVDVVYPPEHRDLADAIVAAGGAVMSEVPPGSPPLPNYFRLRNRLISGLARGVVVIEANQKSGSLITAGCALAQGREVMVVPGVVFAGRNRGGHQLIRDGASLVENAEDVLAVLLAAVPALSVSARRHAPLANGVSEPSAGADPILAALDPVEPVDFDALAGAVGLAAPALLTRLAELELAGLVTRNTGGRFVRSRGKVIT